MKPFAILDGETLPFKHGRFPEDFLWGIKGPEGILIYERKEDVIAYLQDKEWIVYAHNGGKFDYHFFADYIGEDEEILIINGRLAKFKIGKCEFRDSYSIIPMGLAKYQKTVVDYSKFEKEERVKYWEEIVNYLKDDLIFTYELVERFITEYGQSLTLAGAAMKYWKENFYHGEKFTNHDVHFYNYFKSFYYGGRVEVFSLGHIMDSFSVFDINSAYPYAMQKAHAWGKEYSISAFLPNDEEAGKRCFIEMECLSNGALPTRDRDGSLFFPCDIEPRTYFVTGWEYYAALKTGNIKDVRISKVYVFEESISFGGYVDHFYQLKAALKDTDKAGYLMAKLFLNSLYGKFGANPQNYKSYNTLHPRYIRACEKVEGKKFAGMLGKNALMSRELLDDEKHFYNIVTAASITGFVRAMLFEAICGASGVHYVDTDSLTCNSAMLDIGKNLGQWEKEGDFTHGAIAGKKLYAFRKSNGEYKTASKGVKLSGAQIFEIAGGAEIEYKNDAPTFGFKKAVTYISRKIKMRSKKHELGKTHP